MLKPQHAALDICILIPCYNDFAGLVRSINSIVYYPGHFLVLVVDDGSKTAITRHLLYEQVSVTVNIQIVRLRTNLGITKALNRGLDFIAANYPASYIARLDCGDTCHKERFFRQVAFFEQHPGIDLLGTWCYFKDKITDAAYEYSTPTMHEDIQHSMYFRNVFIHPSVMWRTARLSHSRYPEDYPHAEDYGLFYDIVSTKRTAVLGDFLLTCDINPNGISYKNRTVQLKSRLKVIRRYGKNKWLLTAGIFKLLVLIAMPHALIYKIKKQVYKVKRNINE